VTPGRRLRLLGLVVCAFVGGLAEAASLLLLARIAFAMVRPKDDVSASIGPVLTFEASVSLLIALAGALVVFRFMLQLLTLRIQATLYGEVLEEARTRILRHFLYASWSVQSTDRDGRLQELVSSFAPTVASQMGALAGLLVATCSLAAMLGASLFANPAATLAVAAAGLLLMAMLRPFRDAVRRRSNANAQAGVELSTAVSEIASMAQEVHVFGVHEAVGQRLDALVRRSRRASERLQVLAGALPAFYQTAALLVVVGGIGLVYAVGGTRLASLGAVLLIGVRSLSYGQALQQSLQNLHAGAPYIDTIDTESDRYARASIVRGAQPLSAIDTLAFDGVSYTYDGTRFALHDLSFEAKRGQIIGIVGPSGSGKSTLVQLLLRLREPVSGRILVNGVDVHRFGLDDWVRHVVFVSQDAHLFSASVAENIRFFRPNLSLDAVERAARRAHIHDEIAGWPDGYDTAVGERGRKLSGGQRQRLTIARALVGDPDVIVLDEPTSSLDVHSEAAIRDTLVELAEEAMVFVIAHRLSTLDICDRIMVIQDGSLKGFDEPARLEESSTFYREALRLSGLR
jgi:ABC-type multidrug transport system fused ATPase/permease subunit